MPTGESKPTPLSIELEYFESQKAELLKHHEGKFALIVGRNLLGVFDTHEDAYKAGVAQMGNVPMLIKRIARDEPTQSIPALTLGLFRASS